MPGEAAAADLIRRLGTTILRLSQELHELDEMISARFRAQPDAATIISIDGIGALLGAEFLPPPALSGLTNGLRIDRRRQTEVTGPHM
jgi:hypothetical protein